MGRWSRHPMGSDGALDAEAVFFEEFDAQYCKEKEDDWYLEHSEEEIKNYLENLDFSDLNRILSYTSKVDEILKRDRFVIPYIYKKYGAKPKNEQVRDLLIECFDYHDDITGEWNYCSETDENGEVLELKHIRFFKENFDAIMSGEIDLPDDEGLFAAIFDSLEDGLINKE